LTDQYNVQEEVQKQNVDKNGGRDDEQSVTKADKAIKKEDAMYIDEPEEEGTDEKAKE
jgi:hypothetical protein